MNKQILHDILNVESNTFNEQQITAFIADFIRSKTSPSKFIHEDDVVNLIETSILNQFSGTYNIAGDGTITWSKMAESIRVKMINLPSFLLSSITEIAWQTGLQSESNSAGLNFIKYRWTASTQKIKGTLNYQFKHTTESAWQTFCDKKT